MRCYCIEQSNVGSFLREELYKNNRCAKNYHDWIYSSVKPFCGRRILEIGGGTGSIMERFIFDSDIDLYVTTEIDYSLFKYLTQMYKFEHVKVIYGNILDDGFKYPEDLRPDTVLMINVLEHIEDDLHALKRIKNILLPDGRLVLYVPWGQWLYSKYDRDLGHYRRYTRKSLRSLLESAGYNILTLKHIHISGIPVWLLKKVFSNSTHSSMSVMFYDRVILPLSRFIESRINVPFGLSMLCVAIPI